MESNNHNNIIENDIEVDSLLTETQRLSVLVNNIEDQTEREIQRLGKVLETFAKESGDRNYEFNLDYKTNNFYSLYIRSKLKKINKFTKKYFPRRLPDQRRGRHLLETECSDSLSELQDLARVAMAADEVSAGTPVLPWSQISCDQRDETPESIISDISERERIRYGSHVRYRLMKYFTTNRQNNLVYMQKNNNSRSVLNSEKGGTDIPSSINVEMPHLLNRADLLSISSE